jgi:hypothetical protein
MGHAYIMHMTCVGNRPKGASDWLIQIVIRGGLRVGTLVVCFDFWRVWWMWLECRFVRLRPRNCCCSSGRQFLESKWLIFKSKWPWIKKIVFWYGIWDSPQICKFVSNLPIEIKSQKSKLSLRFAFTFVMRMSWLLGDGPALLSDAVFK